jgi:hypothetical protein
VSLPVHAAYVREQYELLRQEAVTADPMGPRGYGMVLLMTRGLSAWLGIVQSLTPRAIAPKEHTASTTSTDCPTWTTGDRGDLTRVLASLVLTSLQEVAPS